MRFPDVALHKEFVGEKKEGSNVVHPPHHLLINKQSDKFKLGLLYNCQRLAEFLQKKIMVAEEVFVNFYSFNPIGVT